MNGDERGLPLEEFIQALTSQLDRAQETMALKARSGLPLTFAVKDMTLDLRTHVDMVGAAVHLRPVGAGDVEASVLHLALTTITRPMIEENTRQQVADRDDPSLREVLGDDMSEEDERRLEWAGVRTVSQLRDLQQHTGAQTIERVARLPVERLRLALDRAAEPRVTEIVPENDHLDPERPPLLRIRGHNLVSDRMPEVSVGDERVPVVDASPREIVLRPEHHQLRGVLRISPKAGFAVSTQFDVTEPIEDEDDES